MQILSASFEVLLQEFFFTASTKKIEFFSARFSVCFLMSKEDIDFDVSYSCFLFRSIEGVDFIC